MDLSRNLGDAVKRFWIASLAAAAVAAASTTAVYAQGGVDKARAAAFDKRMFAGPIGQKTSACFVRRYDASHLAQHPKQKVSAMKLLVTAENPPEEEDHQLFLQPRRQISRPRRQFRLQRLLQPHRRRRTARKSVSAAVSIATAAASMWRWRRTTNRRSSGCERIVLWERKKPDEDAERRLKAGTDDKIFRVDRVDVRECAELDDRSPRTRRDHTRVTSHK